MLAQNLTDVITYDQLFEYDIPTEKSTESENKKTKLPLISGSFQLDTEIQPDTLSSSKADLSDYLDKACIEKEIFVDDQAQNQKIKNEIFGVVESIKEQSVVCEIFFNNEQKPAINVRLPKAIFPAKIIYGSPISISYEQDSNGFRRPKVSIRKQIESGQVLLKKQEAYDLINKF